MNSDCDDNIKSSSRYHHSESCTKLNYVYTSRQCDEYLDYLEELRRIIFGQNYRSTMSSGTAFASNPDSIQYHTQNGNTLVYQIGDPSDYGITLSPIPSETETVITETFCAEEHVLNQREVSKIITPSLCHQMPTTIEERMQNCLHSSSEAINCYLTDSKECLNSANLVHTDYVSQPIAHSQFQKGQLDYYHHESFDYHDFKDVEHLSEGVDESFAVFEEFASVLEETDSVFEELVNESFDEKCTISDDKVRRIVEIVKRHGESIAADTGKDVEQTLDTDVVFPATPAGTFRASRVPTPTSCYSERLQQEETSSVMNCEDFKSNVFQLPSIFKNRSLTSSSPAGPDKPFQPETSADLTNFSENKHISAQNASQAFLVSQNPCDESDATETTENTSTPLESGNSGNSVLVNMIQDYVNMVMDASKQLNQCCRNETYQDNVSSNTLLSSSNVCVLSVGEMELLEEKGTKIETWQQRSDKTEIEKEGFEIMDRKGFHNVEQNVAISEGSTTSLNNSSAADNVSETSDQSTKIQKLTTFEDYEDQPLEEVVFLPIAPRKSSVEKWESATLKAEVLGNMESCLSSKSEKQEEYKSDLDSIFRKSGFAGEKDKECRTSENKRSNLNQTDGTETDVQYLNQEDSSPSPVFDAEYSSLHSQLYTEDPYIGFPTLSNSSFNNCSDNMSETSDQQMQSKTMKDNGFDDSNMLSDTTHNLPSQPTKSSLLPIDSHLTEPDDFHHRKTKEPLLSSPLKTVSLDIKEHNACLIGTQQNNAEADVEEQLAKTLPFSDKNETFVADSNSNGLNDKGKVRMSQEPGNVTIEQARLTSNNTSRSSYFSYRDSQESSIDMIGNRITSAEKKVSESEECQKIINSEETTHDTCPQMEDADSSSIFEDTISNITSSKIETKVETPNYDCSGGFVILMNSSSHFDNEVAKVIDSLVTTVCQNLSEYTVELAPEPIMSTTPSFVFDCVLLDDAKNSKLGVLENSITKVDEWKGEKRHEDESGNLEIGIHIMPEAKEHTENEASNIENFEAEEVHLALAENDPEPQRDTSKDNIFELNEKEATNSGNQMQDAKTIETSIQFDILEEVATKVDEIEETCSQSDETRSEDDRLAKTESCEDAGIIDLTSNSVNVEHTSSIGQDYEIAALIEHMVDAVSASDSDRMKTASEGSLPLKSSEIRTKSANTISHDTMETVADEVKEVVDNLLGTVSSFVPQESNHSLVNWFEDTGMINENSFPNPHTVVPLETNYISSTIRFTDANTADTQQIVDLVDELTRLTANLNTEKDEKETSHDLGNEFGNETMREELDTIIEGLMDVVCNFVVVEEQNYYHFVHEVVDVSIEPHEELIEERAFHHLQEEEFSDENESFEEDQELLSEDDVVNVVDYLLGSILEEPHHVYEHVPNTVFNQNSINENSNEFSDVSQSDQTFTDSNKGDTEVAEIVLSLLERIVHSEKIDEINKTTSDSHSQDLNERVDSECLSDTKREDENQNQLESDVKEVVEMLMNQVIDSLKQYENCEAEIETNETPISKVGVYTVLATESEGVSAAPSFQNGFQNDTETADMVALIASTEFSTSTVDLTSENDEEIHWDVLEVVNTLLSAFNSTIEQDDNDSNDAIYSENKECPDEKPFEQLNDNGVSNELDEGKDIVEIINDSSCAITSSVSCDQQTVSHFNEPKISEKLQDNIAFTAIHPEITDVIERLLDMVSGFEDFASANQSGEEDMDTVRSVLNEMLDSMESDSWMVGTYDTDDEGCISAIIEKLLADVDHATSLKPKAVNECFNMIEEKRMSAEEVNQSPENDGISTTGTKEGSFNNGEGTCSKIDESTAAATREDMEVESEISGFEDSTNELVGNIENTKCPTVLIPLNVNDDSIVQLDQRPITATDQTKHFATTKWEETNSEKYFKMNTEDCLNYKISSVIGEYVESLVHDQMSLAMTDASSFLLNHLVTSLGNYELGGCCVPERSQHEASDEPPNLVETSETSLFINSEEISKILDDVISQLPTVPYLRVPLSLTNEEVEDLKEEDSLMQQDSGTCSSVLFFPLEKTLDTERVGTAEVLFNTDTDPVQRLEVDNFLEVDDNQNFESSVSKCDYLEDNDQNSSSSVCESIPPISITLLSELSKVSHNTTILDYHQINVNEKECNVYANTQSDICTSSRTLMNEILEETKHDDTAGSKTKDLNPSVTRQQSTSESMMLSQHQMVVELSRDLPSSSFINRFNFDVAAEASDCSLCTDMCDTVPTNSSLKLLTESSSTESSLKSLEQPSTSSVLEEVSHFFATACVAALAYMSPSESSTSPFNSDIIEDASKYISNELESSNKGDGK